MAYCTQADIEGEISADDLIALTDDQETGSLNATVLAQIIDNASGYIDARVGNIYAVPFVPTPPSVRNMAITIACYRLFRRRLTPDEKNLFTEDFNEVKAFLDEVNEGKKHIDQSVARTFTQGAFTGRGTAYGAMGSNVLANTM
jgi:phage gp36-like protein